MSASTAAGHASRGTPRVVAAMAAAGSEPCSSRIRELVVYDAYARRDVGSGLSWAIRGITLRVLHLITGTRRRRVGDPVLTASVEGANDDGHDEMP